MKNIEKKNAKYVGVRITSNPRPIFYHIIVNIKTALQSGMKICDGASSPLSILACREWHLFT